MTRLQTPPTTATTGTLPLIYKACKAFIAMCTVDVPSNNIIKGNQNRISLPSNSNEYVIFTIINQIEHGRPVVRYPYNDTTGKLSAEVNKLIEFVVQIDCYSDDAETARSRAQNISSVAMTTEAVDFFNQYGISALFADIPNNTTTTIDAEQYVQRWTVDLHLSYTHAVTLNMDFFTALTYDINNVDVEFPPT